MNAPDKAIHQLIEAMKTAGFWAAAEPAWVAAWSPAFTPHFWHWVQFVYLPARQAGTWRGLANLATQIGPHLHENALHRDILRLAIELDNLRAPETTLTSDYP